MKEPFKIEDIASVLKSGQGEALSERTLAQMDALGSEATAPLLAILQDPELRDAPSENGGWAPVYAAELLGRQKAAEAIPALLQVIAETDNLDPLHDRSVETLAACGEPALEPTLAAYEGSRDESLRRSLRSILARLGVRDTRVFERLIDGLNSDPTIAAATLADYGDPAALPALYRTLDEHPINRDPDKLLANQHVVELVAAIQSLGGELTASHREKQQVVATARDAFRARLLGGRRQAPTEQRSRPKVGRNQPCWCGSGKKYKRCHEREDRKGA